MLEVKEIKKELDKMCEQSRPHSDMMIYLLARYTGQESIPCEVIKYAMDLRPDVQIIR